MSRHIDGALEAIDRVLADADNGQTSTEHGYVAWVAKPGQCWRCGGTADPSSATELCTRCIAHLRGDAAPAPVDTPVSVPDVWYEGLLTGPTSMWVAPVGTPPPRDLPADWDTAWTDRRQQWGNAWHANPAVRRRGRR